MAWGRVSLVRALVLGLLAQVAIAEVDADTQAKADAPPAGGSAEGLAFEPIEKSEIFADNATAPTTTSSAATPGKTAPVEGWWESKICSGEYCVFTNRHVGRGRGIVMVTTLEDFQKVKQAESHLNKAENKYSENPAPFHEVEVMHKGLGLAANKTIRRGKPLMSWGPALMVHKDVLDVMRKPERVRLLETAVAYLPDATRAAFDRQRVGGPKGDERRSVEQILRSAPFEIDLGFGQWKNTQGGEEEDQKHSRHIANYPETAVLQHDCRPNVAHYIDNSMAMHAVVARRTQPGEELTITYVDPLDPRPKRQSWVKRHRGYGTPCGCDACTKKGRAAELEASDARVAELQELRVKLRNHESVVSLDEIAHFLDLLDKERLHVKMAEAYELAAVNYNYLGEDKKAKKYADLSVQAGMIEGGSDSNDVVAMRVMASDVKGHYSYQYTLKRQGKVPKSS
ncbi:hypothetical protein B0T24DRAFT_708582 [Lasiosphaeria ovina]|uniref:SET domain-containing protein n=1 Tax=Lasiosphaeria ovina TaxID=92902 RepID=A0AAE0N3P3_9PEZI|nr:hypothetical protein B0T24DRAFT_708582 [Lasiosphaeria ovina]